MILKLRPKNDRIQNKTINTAQLNVGNSSKATRIQKLNVYRPFTLTQQQKNRNTKYKSYSLPLVKNRVPLYQKNIINTDKIKQITNLQNIKIQHNQNLTKQNYYLVQNKQFKIKSKSTTHFNTHNKEIKTRSLAKTKSSHQKIMENILKSSISKIDIQNSKNCEYTFKIQMMFCQRPIKQYPSLNIQNYSKDYIKDSTQQQITGTKKISSNSINIDASHVSNGNSSQSLGYITAYLQSSNTLVTGNTYKSIMNNNISFQPFKKKLKIQQQNRIQKLYMQSVSRLQMYLKQFYQFLNYKNKKKNMFPYYQLVMKLVKTGKDLDQYIQIQNAKVKQSLLLKKSKINANFKGLHQVSKRKTQGYHRMSLPIDLLRDISVKPLKNDQILWHVGSFTYRIHNHKMLDSLTYRLTLQNIGNSNTFMIAISLSDKPQTILNRIKLQQRYKHQWQNVQNIRQMLKIEIPSCLQKQCLVISQISNNRFSLLQIQQSISNSNMHANISICKIINYYNKIVINRQQNLLIRNKVKLVKTATVGNMQNYEQIHNNCYSLSNQMQNSNKYIYSKQQHRAQKQNKRSIQGVQRLKVTNRVQKYNKKQRKIFTMRYLLNIVDKIMGQYQDNHMQYFSYKQQQQIKQLQRQCGKVYLLKIRAQNQQQIQQQTYNSQYQLQQQVQTKKIAQIFSISSAAQMNTQLTKSKIVYTIPNIRKIQKKKLEIGQSSIYNNIINFTFLYRGTIKNRHNAQNYQHVRNNICLKSSIQLTSKSSINQKINSHFRKDMFLISIFSLQLRLCYKSNIQTLSYGMQPVSNSKHYEQYLVMKTQNCLSNRNNIKIIVVISCQNIAARNNQFYNLMQNLQIKLFQSQISTIGQLKLHIITKLSSNNSGLPYKKYQQKQAQSAIKLCMSCYSNIILNQSLLKQRINSLSIFKYCIIAKANITIIGQTQKQKQLKPLFYKINLNFHPMCNFVLAYCQSNINCIQIKSTRKYVKIPHKYFCTLAYYKQFSQCFQEIYKEFGSKNQLLKSGILGNQSAETYKRRHQSLLKNMIGSEQNGKNRHNCQQIINLRKRIKYRLSRMLSIQIEIKPKYKTNLQQSNKQQTQTPYRAQTKLKIKKLTYSSQKYNLNLRSRNSSYQSKNRDNQLMHSGLKHSNRQGYYNDIFVMIKMIPCSYVWYHHQKNKVISLIIYNPNQQYREYEQKFMILSKNKNKYTMHSKLLSLSVNRKQQKAGDSKERIVHALSQIQDRIKQNRKQKYMYIRFCKTNSYANGPFNCILNYRQLYFIKLSSVQKKKNQRNNYFQIVNCNNTHNSNLLCNKIIKLDDLWQYVSNFTIKPAQYQDNKYFKANKYQRLKRRFKNVLRLKQQLFQRLLY